MGFSYDLKFKYITVIVTLMMQRAVCASDFTVYFLLGVCVKFEYTDKIFNNPRLKRTEYAITGHCG